jgi:hypothetical protein
MDLNQLYFRHQLSLIRASMASDDETCLAHEAQAAGIAHSIGAFQHGLGAEAALSWQVDCAQ